MPRLRSIFVLAFLLLLSLPLFSQGTTSQATATCNFNANEQIVVEYQRMKVDPKKPVFGHEIPYGQVWAPGGKPMTLFITSPVSIGGKELPIAGYTMFVIPADKQWTLVVSKSTDMSGKYDKDQDLVRVPMEYGKLSQPEDEFSVYFAHVAPDQCSMRIDLAKSRAWVTFQEKK